MTYHNHSVTLPWKRKLEYGVGFVKYTDPASGLTEVIPTSWKNINQQSIDDSDALYMLLLHDSTHPLQSPLMLSTSFRAYGREPQ
jgi:hypothetical protein